MSITGDTAKILDLTLERLCTITLRPILPEGRMRQDLWEEEFTHTSQTRSPYILLYLLVWQQDEPPQLNNLGRAMYHKAALEAI